MAPSELRQSASDAAPLPNDPASAALLAELQAARWNITQVARRLGVARMTLYRRMKRAGIVAPNQRD